MLRLFLFILSCSFAAFAATNNTNSIIALVNNEVLTFSHIQNKIKPGLTKAEKLLVINQEIDLLLQLEKIKKIGIRVKPEALNLAMKQIAANNSITMEQLRSSVEFNDITQEIINQLSLRALKSFVLQEVNIKLTDAEIQAISDKNPKKLTQQIKIAQIFINSIDETNDLLKSKDVLIKQHLTKIRDKIEKGDATFSDMAKLHSQDPSYKNGGISKWLDKQAALEVFPFLSKFKINELSQVFKIQHSWSIVKIIDERSIEAELIKLKLQKLRIKQENYYKNWVKKLRKNAYIEIFEHKL